jgi:hypothetical protein
MADLSRWLDEKYVISEAATELDELGDTSVLRRPERAEDDP